VTQHFQRLIHADDNGVPGAAREPLHFHFDISHGNLLRGKTGGQVGVLTGIYIAFRGQHCQHPADVLEVFVRIPAPAHTVDIQFECLVGQAFMIKDTHDFL
jgi:hypothetical protein